jgi:hypothetical protein
MAADAGVDLLGCHIYLTEKARDMLRKATLVLADELKCSICLGHFSSPFALPCAHSFCDVCLKRMMKVGTGSCALCKTKFSRRQLVRDEWLERFVRELEASLGAHGLPLTQSQAISCYQQPKERHISAAYQAIPEAPSCHTDAQVAAKVDVELPEDDQNFMCLFGFEPPEDYIPEKTLPRLCCGDVCDVARRTWPGMNREGGRAIITGVNESGTYNVKYVVSLSRERDIEARWISLPQPELEVERHQRNSMVPRGQSTHRRQQVGGPPHVASTVNTSSFPVCKPHDPLADASEVSQSREIGSSAILAGPLAPELDIFDFPLSDVSAAVVPPTPVEVPAHTESIPRRSSTSAQIESTHDVANSVQLPMTNPAALKHVQKRSDSFERGLESVFTVGMIVHVAPRTWPGVNKPGGTARIIRIHEDDHTCDVKYVISKSSIETRVPMYLLSEEKIDLGRERRRYLRLGDGVLRGDYSVADAHQPTHRRPLVITVSGYRNDSHANTQISEFVKKFCARNENSAAANDLTHVVLHDKGKKATLRSIKYLRAVARGAWVVSLGWIRDSLARGSVCSEAAFEIVGDDHRGITNAPMRSRLAHTEGKPTLFSGLSFALVGSFIGEGCPSRPSLEALLTDCGGCLTRPSHDCQFIVHCESANLDLLPEHPKYAPVRPEWVLDCISEYRLLPLAEYAI